MTATGLTVRRTAVVCRAVYLFIIAASGPVGPVLAELDNAVA
jgi:hypothetical protein